MQLITAIYCLALLDQPLAAELSINVKCDVYICNSRVIVVMLN